MVEQLKPEKAKILPANAQSEALSKAMLRKPLSDPKQRQSLLEKLGPLTNIPRAKLAIGQGVYYVLTGLWPIVSIDSFMAVTGPKTDLWLVKTVGLLLAAIGAVLLTSGARGKVAVEIFMLAVFGAAALTVVELVYPVKGVISPIYLLDAVVEISLISLWIVNRGH